MPDNINFTPDQFDRLIDAFKGNKQADLEAQAKAHAEASHKLQNPQNETCPQVSVYNPRGERDHPKAELKCPIFEGQFPLEPDTLKVKEVDYLNQLEPGIYEVTKSDGSVVAFTVKASLKGDGRTTDYLLIHFPAGDAEQRQSYPPFEQMLREVVEQIDMRKALEGVSQ